MAQPPPQPKKRIQTSTVGSYPVPEWLTAIKINRVETPEEIAETIRRAEEKLGVGRIRYVHPDCGFWMLKRSVADRKITALARGRDLYISRA